MTRRFAREINLRQRTTLIESPQSNGMAKAFVRTMKRDYVRVSEKPDATAAISQLPSWLHSTTPSIRIARLAIS